MAFENAVQVISPFESFNAFAHAPRRLPDLIERFHQLEALEDEDQVVELNTLHMSEKNNLVLPGQGEYALTDWSRRQLASLVGINWDRWFQHADPAEQAEEINRRFSRSNSAYKLRTQRVQQPEADGILRGFVSPGYTPVRDSEVAQMMYVSLKSIDKDLKLIRADLTDRSTSYVIGIGKPYQVGSDGQVGDVWGGILVKNSGLGFACLSITLFLTRLVCRNGMTAPLKNAVLFRRKHTKGILQENLPEILGQRLLDVPGQLRHSGQVLLTANQTPITNPEEEITRVLNLNKLPKRLLEPVLHAYNEEPMATAFGISSAFTRAAQKLSAEERLQIEDVAAEYLQPQ